ncbi:MAG: helix-turn-helix domain-containing protein [Lentisphaeria bacterium]|nr:helix-turn-helix domain-containing protein [Lentisphaeria bacterium]
MARQQRLPFEWQNDNSESGENTPRVRPVTREQPTIRASSSAEMDPALETTEPALVPDDGDNTETPAPAESVEEPPMAMDTRDVRDGQEDYEDDVPTSLGQVLVEARAAAGLSIAEASDRTKVPPQFIEAAENEAYSDFPARLYARGHLLKLCAAYKIAGQPVVDLYQAAVGSADKAGHAGGGPARPRGVVTGNVDFSHYAPALQTQASASGAGHRLTVMLVSLGLSLIVGVVLITFILTQIRSARLNRQNDDLEVDPNAAAGLAIEEFIQETPLPLKKLPMP